MSKCWLFQHSWWMSYELVHIVCKQVIIVDISSLPKSAYIFHTWLSSRIVGYMLLLHIVAQHERTNQLTFPGPRPSMNVGRCVGITGCLTLQVLVITPWMCHRTTIIIFFMNSSDQTSGIVAAISCHKGCINQNIISRLKCITMVMKFKCYTMQLYHIKPDWFHKYTSMNLKNKECIWIPRHPLSSICNVVSISMDDNTYHSQLLIHISVFNNI